MWVFGQILDRYATEGYGPPVGTLEAIEMAARTGALAGVVLNYPFPEPDLAVHEVAAALRKHNLSAVSVTPVIYGREFRSGSFTNPDPSLRRKAVDLGHEAVAAARELGAGHVKFWPGQDGYDYPFQVDYATVRRHGIEGIRDVARNFPDMTFGIEYKLKEPRARLLWSTAAASLLGIAAMGVDNVGLVLDFGHSLFAKENPAEVFTLAHERGCLVDIELDDNYREDPVDAVRTSVATLRLLEERCERIPLDELAAIQERHDALAAQRLIQKVILA
ncbi:sugar phosphate isomerase/epimerase family protein [Micromonospora citrea]|uniref:sugar phosphate isomerase/epimerase family protein n=1 Tax=Micromonospora citrea TaxID=47855 RepID=UPI003C6801B8